MSEIHQKTVTLADGAVATYSVAGDGDDVVVLLHGGLPGSSGYNGWRLMMEPLAQKGLTVIAPDRPGFGNADLHEDHFPRQGMKSWEEFLHQFVLALGLDTFYLGGNSQGAQIAAHYAVNHYERLKGVIFVASAGLSASLQIPAEELAPADMPPRFTGTEESMRQTLEHIVLRKDQLTDELISSRTAIAEKQKDSYAAGMAGVRSAFENANSRQWMEIGSRLSQLDVPMIYLHGRQDVLNPVENAYKQEDRLPNCQFFYPDNCGHQGQTDQPELFATVFGEFLTQGKVSAATAEAAGISQRRAPLENLVEPAALSSSSVIHQP